LSFTSCFEDIASNHNYARLSIIISTLKINHMKQENSTYMKKYSSAYFVINNVSIFVFYNDLIFFSFFLYFSFFVTSFSSSRFSFVINIRVLLYFSFINRILSQFMLNFVRRYVKCSSISSIDKSDERNSSFVRLKESIFESIL
jgi:hypothetical protein